MSITVPQPTQQVDIEMSDGAIIVLRRYGNADGPRVAFSHGNGLAIDAYVGFWKLFIADYDVIVFDMRNHGHNPTHHRDGHNWVRVTEDLQELWRAFAMNFGAKPVSGVFHSLSAISSLRQVARFGASWRRLVLFDPPLWPCPGHEMIPVQEASGRRMAKRARNRPQSYVSPEEFADQIRTRTQFQRWRPGTHELYARATLRHNEATGRWDLACPRDYEADIFESNQDDTIWNAIIDGLAVPVTLIGADPALDDIGSHGRICEMLAQEAGLDCEIISNTTHLLQLEEPEACAEAVKRRIDADQ
jgi:pimeloyl-ACP methyl ester carboxylesterase